MRQPLVVVYEADGLLGLFLRRLSKGHGWTVREVRRPSTCLRLLRQGRPGVLVLKLSKDVATEMELLERVSWLLPEAATIVVGEVEDPTLAALAWDLGAAYVLLPPAPRELLPEVVAGFLARETSHAGAAPTG